MLDYLNGRDNLNATSGKHQSSLSRERQSLTRHSTTQSTTGSNGEGEEEGEEENGAGDTAISRAASCSEVATACVVHVGVSKGSRLLVSESSESIVQINTSKQVSLPVSVHVMSASSTYMCFGASL